VAGVPTFIGKVGVDLQFRSINTSTSNLVTVTEDVANNEIDLDIIAGTDGQIMSTLAGVPQWTNLTDDTNSGSILFSNGAGGIGENNAQLFWDNTDQRLFVGPTITTLPEVKLNVNGTTRTQGIRNSSGTSGVPAYRFTDNADTGMFLADPSGILGFSSNNVEAMRIDASQNVGIGPAFDANTIGARLHVDGNIWADGELRASGVLTENDPSVVIPDYVFQNYFNGYSSLKPTYSFNELSQVEAFIKKNHHLPGVVSALEAKEDGFWNLSRSNLQNLEKIEELFLHTIAQEKKIKTLENQNENLSKELDDLKKDMALIKEMLFKNKK